jgi:Listeria-Bacteroides repeat domain (List_Bact_rpt).
MKKTTIVILLLITTASILIGCSSSIAFTPKEEARVTLYNDGMSVTETFNIGELAFITPFMKEGYYMKGLYTENSGGEQYFNSDGLSLDVWKKDNPTTLYAQWESLAGYSCNTSVRFSVNLPISFNEVSSFSGGYGSYSYELYLSDTMTTIIQGNLERNIEIKLSFKVEADINTSIFGSVSSFHFTVYDSLSGGAETLYISQSYDIFTNQYIEISITFTTQAQLIKKGYIVVKFEKPLDFFSANIKELYAEFKFI